jgi:hypothetical protein
MKTSKVIVLLLYVFVSAPIWYYLAYKVLESVNASELMWFLYWVYTPVTILSAIIVKVSSDD